MSPLSCRTRLIERTPAGCPESACAEVMKHVAATKSTAHLWGICSRMPRGASMLRVFMGRCLTNTIMKLRKLPLNRRVCNTPDKGKVFSGPVRCGTTRQEWDEEQRHGLSGPLSPGHGNAFGAADGGGRAIRRGDRR